MHVSALGMSSATDSQIIERAIAEGRVIVTWDTDFHVRIVLSRKSKPSCIRFRMDGLGTRQQAILIHNVTTQFAGELARGALVTVTEQGARCRLLPVTD